MDALTSELIHHAFGSEHGFGDTSRFDSIGNGFETAPVPQVKGIGASSYNHPELI
jgi:hypothetical protein